MPTALKTVLSTCLAMGVCLSAANCGAQTESAPARPRAPVDPMTLIGQVARAYQDAPALVDDYQITMTAGGTEHTDTSRVRLGQGADAYVAMEGYEITAHDGQFTIEHVDRPTKYYQQPLDGDLMKTFTMVSGGNSLPVPHAAFRYGKNTDDYIAAFGLARADGLQVVGTDSFERDGKSFDRLKMKNEKGIDVSALIDPETKFVDTITLSSPGVEITASMSPDRLDRLPEPLAVVTEGRRRVDSLSNLMNLVAGDEAPDLTLPALDGHVMKLADLRGSLVVLDFWATWCGPCKMALPKLQEFATWADKEGYRVAIWPIDIAERLRTEEAKRGAVERFWKSAGFTMEPLMDYDNVAARTYHVGPIPHTVVVGPDGKILSVEVGFNPNAVEHFKELTRRTFGG